MKNKFNKESQVSQTEEPVDAEWIKVSPFGEFPGTVPGRPQIFGKAEAQAMEREFESVRGKLGRLWRGVPIYIGHPDVNREIWNDERRLGKVVELEVRADGLWARCEWNDLGNDNLKNGYWMFPSPRWDAPAGGAQFKPVRLISIGLTNTPRIKDSEPVANADDAAEEIFDENNQQKNEMNRKLMIEKLGLVPEATDEEILAKLDEIMKVNADAAEAEKNKLSDEAAKANSGTANEEAEKQKEELKKARCEVANAKVDLAIAEGKITAAERAVWVTRLSGDGREVEANALMNLKPSLNTKPLNLNATHQAVTDEHGRREAIANAVQEVRSKQPNLSYAQAYAQVQKDPKLASVFAAMNEPGRES